MRQQLLALVIILGATQLYAMPPKKDKRKGKAQLTHVTTPTPQQTHPENMNAHLSEAVHPNACNINSTIRNNTILSAVLTMYGAYYFAASGYNWYFQCPQDSSTQEDALCTTAKNDAFDGLAFLTTGIGGLWLCYRGQKALKTIAKRPGFLAEHKRNCKRTECPLIAYCGQLEGE